MVEILKCRKCGRYTLEKYCECGGVCVTVKPVKFSPVDKYARHRLAYKLKIGGEK